MEKRNRFCKKNIKKNFHVVAIDYGIKKNILRYFSDFNCKVTVVSCKTTLDIIKLKPNGIFIQRSRRSSRTGKYAIPIIKELIKIFLYLVLPWSQILALTLGARTKIKVWVIGALIIQSKI